MSALLQRSGFEGSSSGAEGSTPADTTRYREDPGMAVGAAPIQAPSSSTSKDQGPPTSPALDQQPQAHENPLGLALSYAQTLQTGVFGEEPMPEFAELYLFPTVASRQAARASQEEFIGSPVDDWSSRMEQQLRMSFGRHPFAANVRVSVACRSTQCKLQFVEPTVRVQPPGELGPNSLMMMLNVVKEPWFRENFPEWKTQAATPVSAKVAYQLVVLPRRPAQP